MNYLINIYSKTSVSIAIVAVLYRHTYIMKKLIDILAKQSEVDIYSY